MNSRLYCIIVSFMFTLSAEAQYNRFWIQFSDKAGSPFSIDRPSEFLSQASVDRRTRYNIPYHISDLPVNQSYISQVEEVPHVFVRYASKWFNGVVISVDDSQFENEALKTVTDLPFVAAYGKVKRLRTDLPAPDTTDGTYRTAKHSASLTNSQYAYGRGGRQAQQLGVQCLHEKGFRGEGITIAVLDAGFFSVPANTIFDSLRAEGRLLGTRDFVDGGPDAYVGGEHGTMVLSCMAALAPGQAVGTAPKASYWLLRTEEGGAETQSEEFNWIRGAEFADSAGADILTTSLGYTTFDNPAQDYSFQTLNGRTAPMSVAATMAARKGMFVLNAAGNEGTSSWRHIGVPADADSICTVGAIDSNGVRADFSSMGPTADGRIKPDLMARGAHTWVCRQNNECFLGNGTSFATPVLAGAVACYWQANRQLNNIRLLNRLKNNASKNTNPDTLYGWGIPNMCPAADGAFTAYAGQNQVIVKLKDVGFEYINMQLCDMLGNTLFTSKETMIDDYHFILQTPGLAAGIYILKLETPHGIRSQKILKLDL